MVPPSLQLSAFPEELLEKILSHLVVAPLSSPPRPSWHRPNTPSTGPSAPIRGRLAVLLVSKAFCRISTPLFYHTIHLVSASQLHGLLSSALRPNPCLAAHIRRVVLSGVWAEGGELLELCGPGLRMLDIALDITQLCPATQGIVRDLDAEDFCEGLKEIKGLTHLVVRKPNNVYLTQPKPRYVLAELAKAVNVWDWLEYADLAFRLSDDSNTANLLVHAAQPLPPSQLQAGPMTALVQSLSTRPKLHTFCTLLPSVWNETILRVSTNPSLERIILGDGMGPGRDPVAHTRGTVCSGRDFYAAPVSSCSPTPLSTAPLFESSPTYSGPGTGILGTGLFFMQAKKHIRLSELIRAGTSIIRTRAQTLGTSMMPPCGAITASAPSSLSSYPSSSPSGTPRSHPNAAGSTVIGVNPSLSQPPQPSSNHHRCQAQVSASRSNSRRRTQAASPSSHPIEVRSWDLYPASSMSIGPSVSSGSHPSSSCTLPPTPRPLVSASTSVA
ncbi:unnamed protein product [Cyclocybe aegerita]|uniref:F-box domain-containing protein n=1 Tax=Cyclocybe aegerita TaxID=1973307 RepID=A0A8S0WBU4_CYCAE|nr:unnamed protein product [Cyclocybe aegerita]